MSLGNPWSNPWSNLTPTQRAMVMIGVPAGAVAGYILYRRYRERRDEHCVLVSDNQMAMDMKVPRDAVKVIIGRQGSMIKQLRKETGARIEVEDGEELAGGLEGPTERLLTIVGSPVQVCKAKVAIHQLLADSTTVTEELRVPHRAVGRIIGRGGESVREICRATGAKVLCEEPGKQPMEVNRLVRISGTRQEVVSAKALILAKVDQEEAFRQRLASSAARRRQRKHPIGRRAERAPGEESSGSPASDGEWVLGAGESEADSAFPGKPPEEPAAAEKDGPTPNNASPVSKFEIPSPDFGFPADEHLEVYVSASENPSHFWIQILGSRCLQLDNLTREMSRYYSGLSGTGEAFFPKPGDIVAAPFVGDSSWYRARVLGFLASGNADLYYVDYGDNGAIPIRRLQLLRSDFLSLPFQAVECCLDGIQPLGTEWTNEALNCFEALTYCAGWTILLARICSYSQTGGITRPQVKLFDRTRGENLDIGEELIRLGHATRCPRTVGTTAGSEPTTVSLQKLLNDVAGGMDGDPTSQPSVRSHEEHTSTSWQSDSETALHSSEEAAVIPHESL